MLQEIAIGQSGHVAFVIWDDETMDLTVGFRGGQTYRYEKVPGNVANGFAQALSPGAYLNSFIKGSYTYERTA